MRSFNRPVGSIIIIKDIVGGVLFYNNKIPYFFVGMSSILWTVSLNYFGPSLLVLVSSFGKVYVRTFLKNLKLSKFFLIKFFEKFYDFKT